MLSGSRHDPLRGPVVDARCLGGGVNAPGEELARDACKWWVPGGGAARIRRAMTERELSATDAALRERITELGVHIPCGGLRGPLQPRNPRSRWQSCPDEDSPEKWEARCLARARPLHHLLQVDGWRNVSLGMAGVR